MKKTFLRRGTVLLWRTARGYGQGGGAQTSAALAYFLILTIFPLLLCVSHILGAFHMSITQLTADLVPLLPQSAVGLINEYLAYAGENQEPMLLVFAVGTIVMSASAAVRTLLGAMDRLFERRERPGIWRFIWSIALSLLFLAALYISVLVIFTGSWFYSFLAQTLRGIVTLPEIGASLWLLLRYAILFFLMLALVLVIFALGTPQWRLHRRALRLCSVLTAAAVVAGSAVFSGFINLSSRYSLMYGSLASLVIMLVWLYFCGTILLLGAVVLSMQIQGKSSVQGAKIEYKK